MMQAIEPAVTHWRLEDLNLAETDVALVRNRAEVFLLICGASFIESGSETYSRHLVNHFQDDPEIGAWLRHEWEPEELQHGRVLKAYVHRVWPEFDWDRAYACFFKEFSKHCTHDGLEATRGREMVARCVVESATTTYYQAIGTICDEPVLRHVLSRIRGDEVRHYKHFYRYFLRYSKQEDLGRTKVLGTILRRLVELRRTDARIALRHAANWSPLARGRSLAAIESSTESAYQLLGAAYPLGLAIRMVLKPLQLHATVQRGSETMMVMLARHLLSHG